MIYLNLMLHDYQIIFIGLLWSLSFSESILLLSNQFNLSCNNSERNELDILTEHCSRHRTLHRTLECYGNLNNFNNLKDPRLKKLENLIICNWTKATFNPIAIFHQTFPRIKSLIIEQGALVNISTNFPVMHHLQLISITRTCLSYIESKTFKYIYFLRVLDLRWNQLKELEQPLIMSKVFSGLYLIGNPWNCTKNLKWLAIPGKGELVIDRNELFCSDHKYKGRHLLTVMNYKNMLKTSCKNHDDLKNCSCTMHHIILKSHTPLYTVNCSNLQLYNLPEYLPTNTSSFYANDNKITDISPLRNNIHYTYLADIHLDNNLIESIDVLEGGYWFENFRLLSLKGNRLRKIPVYALDNALEDNTHASLIFLSGNPWSCSCKFSMRFRDILMKYKPIIKDAQNITCTYGNVAELKNSQIISLSREAVCKPQQKAKIFYLDIINGILICLIVLILGKLAYDYYYYKYYGRVPWIVMKLP